MVLHLNVLILCPGEKTSNFFVVEANVNNFQTLATMTVFFIKKEFEFFCSPVLPCMW